ncbi:MULTISPECIES: exo-alpha-sialidase [Roseobacteraceae]|uniref:exo-alpha-sialidase n=1 Tax=Roseobacteraceae TaxID=2854170 RepID=UPI0013BB876B|nr:MULTISPECIES: exo-alpha-sialidase [unclassified Salipiger]NDV48196.1 exo-alpha-sialidase [Salipiger sp. PrR003]NDW35424.1 exo-alpha-sialidase [Salipiger sp. PrR007]
MSTAPTLLVGTTKGAFLLAKGEDGWSAEGPFCNGWPINHMAGDAKTGTIWAGGGNEWFGAGVWRRNGRANGSANGDGWELAKLAGGQMDDWISNDPELAARLGMTASGPAPYTGQLQAVWSLKSADGTLYAGGKPAALYASKDGGETWEEIESLRNHPSADDWMPGAAGLTLHTIVADPADPKRMWLAISAAGVFATEDGGETWERRNRRSNAPATPSSHPAAGDGQETGHCVHNMGRAAGGGDVLYQQNHHGVYRSRDGGRSWDEITEGLPSTFGFPIGLHPSNPETIWTLPLNGDTEGRYPPDAKAAVWRSRNAGESWEACRDGLPQQGCFFTVLRQAMAVDAAEPAGVFFGTNSGSVFGSFDEGDSWSELARHLPTVLCVEVMPRA